MSSIEPWIYIVVPTFLVALLILIKRRQEEIDHYVEPQYAENEVAQTLPSEAPSRTSVQAEETQSKTREKERPHNCLHYLGYLYMKKSPNSTQIPNECYGCEKLLQCLYTPNVVEKLYGE